MQLLLLRRCKSSLHRDFHAFFYSGEKIGSIDIVARIYKASQRANRGRYKSRSQTARIP